MAELRWEDQEAGRRVLVREGLVAELPQALAAEGWDDYELLSTERALAGAPGLAEAAERTHLVAPGQVPDVSAAILGDVGSGRLVALGGGRVIDTAKAIAATRGGEVAAAPTTLSGAEMTAIHRLPAGHENLPGVRPSLVLADPAAMAGLPEPGLRATAMNALAHAADSLYTPLADGRSRADALRGAELIATALDSDRDRRDRLDLALGALLSARAIDSAGLAIHHVVSQTVVRVCGTPHAETNAAILPVVMEEMSTRAPEQIEALARAIGADPGEIRARLEQLAGGRRALGELGAKRDCVEQVLEAATARPELFRMTPGEVRREDLARVIEEAW
ncbi:MAG: iron-containing alcohol dehydrogenase [Actinomycetota bacterium]|nr:iron-containing alcohol dehydrogenase [Actinomycetota bacterium]